MGKINVLSFAVANLIAAGEVVDRPSSVIKELLENAIDSGADKITVEIQNGGTTYMRVSDNGCGMTPEDLPVAIRRHATSKIKEADDLDSILTLGFRGEALAAISSVSDMRIISKPHDASVGAMLSSHAGVVTGITERACADGTTIIVENLFANVPARRKFLKKDVTESMAVNAMVEKIALSRPDIAFKLIIDGKPKLETVGDGKLKNAIYSLFGREFANRLIEASIEIDGIKVHGYIGRPDSARANRNYQNFFINGRYVKTKTALAAIEQAYTSYIASEKFPCCVLFIEINPATVDVNVHPAKLEVKFSNERPVFEAIYYCVRNALESDTQRPDVALTQPKAQRMSDKQAPIEDGRRESLAARQIKTELYTRAEDKGSRFSSMSAGEYLRDYTTVKQPVKSVSSAEVTPMPEQKQNINIAPQIVEKRVHKADPIISSTSTVEVQKTQQMPDTKQTEIRAMVSITPRKLGYRIIGEAFNSYIIVENEDKLLLVDKHAAHERIVFESMRKSMVGERAAQLLMLPIEVMMTGDEIHALEEYRSEIEAVGFTFSSGKYVVNVTEIPEGISTDAVVDMLTVMAERIKSGTGSAGLTRDIVFEKALYQASCKAAVKAGREYPKEYVQWIVDKLMEIPDITVCPHGRPVAIELTHKNLDYQFERS